ncbi:MAG: DUF2970 domain-containing protein [Pseudomonadales bacterium]
MRNEEPDDNNKRATPGAWQIIRSTIAAAFGVQSEANRQRDFGSRKSVYIYIASGIIFTALFVLAVAWIVSMVLAGAA